MAEIKTKISDNALIIDNQSIDIDLVLPRLHELFATKYLQELTGIDSITPNPTTVVAMVNAIRAGNESNKCWQKTICYYNATDKTIDIIQPFYFVPLIPETTPQVPYNAVKTNVANLAGSEYYLEPSAKRILAKKPAYDQVETEETLEDLYKQTPLDRKQLAVQLITTDQTRNQIAKTLAKTFEFSEEFADKLIFNTDFNLISINPVILSVPQWGYFTYKLTLSNFKSIIIDNPITTTAATQLVGDTKNTIIGADIIHDFLSTTFQKIGFFKGQTYFSSSLVGGLIESRVDEVTYNASLFAQDLSADNKTIFEGDNEQSAKIQRPISEQITLVKNLPTFIKTSAVWGNITPQALEPTDNYLYNISVRQGEGAKITNVSVSGSLTLVSDRQGGAETITITKNKTVLLEQEFVDKIKEATSLPLSEWNAKFKDLAGSATNIYEFADVTRDTFIDLAENEQEALQKDLFLHLALAVRDGIINNKFSLTEVPTGLVSDKLAKQKGKKNKKKVTITDFSTIFGPFTLGALPPTEAKKSKAGAINQYVELVKDGKDLIVKYTPDFTSLLSQTKWLLIQNNKATLDYNLLQINKYSSQQSQVTKNLTQTEYAYITGLREEIREKLRSATNYKDFFDNLYDNLIFYKKAPPVLKQLSRVSNTPLTEDEKDKILQELFNRKNEIIEQAFGGTGCLPAALKGIKTIEDLYDNILHKGNWALFLTQVIDRFRCELSKLGGGNLACLANFEAVDTYQSALNAKDVIENFPDFLRKELEIQPTSPIFNIIYDRKIPTLPSIDWYKCLRAFLLAIILRVVTELITAFIQGILSLLNIDCKIDFSSCEQSAIDPDSSAGGISGAGKEGLLASGAASNAQATTATINDFFRTLKIEQQLTQARLIEYIRFLVGQMSVGSFKALLTGEPPQHIFDHGKYLTNNFFAPVDFTDNEFRQILAIIADNYDFEVFIGALILQKVLPDETCPPQLVGGDDVLDEIKDALRRRLQKEGSKDPNGDADKEIAKAKGELENRVSTFCELLNTTTTALGALNSAPSVLAGFSNYGISRTLTTLVTQLRIKPFYDYGVLKYLYTGALFGKPDRDDIIRADLSLAYNILYRTYDLTRVTKKGYQKNWNLTPNTLKPAIGSRWETTKEVVANDTFEKEFLQDVLKLVTAMNPFLLPLYDNLEAALFTNNASSLTQMEKSLLGASRDLNNSNYFYAWIENIIALLPVVDPRRFGTKYPNFVKENYPQGINVNTESEIPFELKIDRDQFGLHYRYTNGTQTIVSLDIGLENFEIQIGEDFSYTRSLPKLPEPFLVDDEFDYEDFVNKNQEIWKKKNSNNPQEKIFLSLFEQSLKNINISPDDAKNNWAEIEILFQESLGIIDTEFKTAFESPDKKVADFFFRPYLEAQKIPAGVFKEGMTLDELRNELKKLGNPQPPVQLFFERADNIFSDVFFEDTIAQEVTKLVNKVETTLKDFYRNLASGETYDPNKIASLLSTYNSDSKIYYELERITTSTSSPTYVGQALYSQKTLTKTQQEKILAAAKEILGE